MCFIFNTYGENILFMTYTCDGHTYMNTHTHISTYTFIQRLTIALPVVVSHVKNTYSRTHTDFSVILSQLIRRLNEKFPHSSYTHKLTFHRVLGNCKHKLNKSTSITTRLHIPSKLKWRKTNVCFGYCDLPPIDGGYHHPKY